MFNIIASFKLPNGETQKSNLFQFPVLTSDFRVLIRRLRKIYRTQNRLVPQPNLRQSSHIHHDHLQHLSLCPQLLVVILGPKIQNS